MEVMLYSWGNTLRVGSGLLLFLPLAAIGKAAITWQVRGSELLAKFVHAEHSASWTPSLGETNLARRILRMPEETPMRRAAASFCLAVAGPQHESYVAQMVKSAMLTSSAATEADDGKSALPDALWLLFRKFRSKAAAGAVARLDLDGAPGDMLADVRDEAFQLDPMRLADAWYRLGTSARRPLTISLQVEAEMDPRLAAAIRTGCRSRHVAVRTLSRAVAKIKARGHRLR